MFDVNVDALNGWKKYKITVEPEIVISPSYLPDGDVGRDFPDKYIQASGGTGGFTYRSFKGRTDLPPGLSINPATGLFSGHPTRAGDYNFFLGATDKTTGAGAHDSGMNGWREFNITIRSPLDFTFSGPLTGRVSEAYSGTIRPTGGDGKYHFEADGLAGTGLSLNGNRISGTPTRSGPIPLVIRVKDNTLNEKDRSYPINIGSVSNVNLTIGKLLHGHFTLASQGHEKLTITGQVSGADLSETNHPDKVILTIKQPGSPTFVDVKTLGKLEWDPHWQFDGWEFTLSEISWSPKDGVPRFEMSAALDQHTSQPAVVKFPLAEFVRNLEFRRDGEPITPKIYVKSGDQSLSLHMAFYNALDELSAKLSLPNGVTGKAPAPDASLPMALRFRADWDGHMQPILFEIRKDNVLKVDTGKPQVLNITVPVKVQPTFRDGEVWAELTSNNDSVEHIPNNTAPNKAHLLLQMDTSS